MILAIKDHYALPAAHRVLEPGSREADTPNKYNAQLEAMATDQAEIPAGSIAVMPLFGVVTQHPINSFWGGTTSTDLFGQAFDRVMGSSKFSGVVINIHSPGGSAWGTQELADKIYEARNEKPIAVVANAMAASAAYWIGSAAKNFAVTPSGEAGAIGVYTYSFEQSDESLESEGVKRKIYSVPKKKAEVAGIAPASEETDQEILAEVQQVYDQFISTVARNRGVSVKKAKEDFGGGGVKLAKDAVESGMADQVATLDEVVSKMVKKVNRKGRRHSSANDRRIRLEKLKS